MLAQDYWGNDMSGMEPILIGAALGAGASGVMGGDPLQGALMGAAGGGLGGLAGGAGGVAGGAGGATGGASGAAVSPLAAAGTNSLASAATLIPPSGMSAAAGIGGTTPYMTAAPGLLSGIDPMKMMQMGGDMFGDGQSQQQRISAPKMRQGQAPEVQAPIDELMRLQMMAQRQRKPISLL